MQAFILNLTNQNFASTIALQATQCKSFRSGARILQGELGGAMADTSTGSTVPRRQLGRYLRDLRNAAGLKVRDAARGLEWSEAKMWRIETGQTSLRSLDVEAMCRIYGAQPDMTTALMSLAKETKARGWWHAFADAMPDYFDLYIGLEAAASQLFDYNGALVTGLFQTEDYARTLIRNDNPGLGDAEVARRVRLRTARQAILRRPINPPLLQVAVDESVLRRPVGGSEIMAEQLDRLEEVSELPNVSLRVVPFSARLHHGMLAGPFTLLRFPPNGSGGESEPPTVYAELLTGAVYLDKPSEIERYSFAFNAIWQQALDEPSSRDLIRQAREDLRHG
jgi:transcriptional regulator with XRE-family HTH domain